jgi:hypothetical protein
VVWGFGVGCVVWGFGVGCVVWGFGVCGERSEPFVGVYVLNNSYEVHYNKKQYI